MRLVKNDPSLRFGHCDPNGVHDDGRSLGDLFRDLRHDGATLLRSEIELAKVEVKESALRVVRDAALIAGGAFLLFLAAIALVMALSAGLYVAFDEFLPEWAALWLGPLAAGVLLAGIGAILIASGRARLRRASLAPKLTQQTMKENTEWIREKIT